MISTRPTIPMRYVVDVIERSRPRKTTIARALEAAAFSERALASRRMRISAAQWERFFAVLRRDRDDELFGYFTRPVPSGAFATLLRLLTTYADLASCMDAGERFYRLFDRHRYWRLDTEGARSRLSVVSRDRGQARSVFFVHSMLLGPVRTLSWLAARPLPIDVLHLPPSLQRYAREARYLFGCEPDFSSAIPSITLKRALLDLPVVRTSKEADEWVKISLQEFLQAPRVATIETELRTLLSASKPIADVSMSDAARALQMSRATLARALANSGISFQEVKDNLRRDHAIGLLTGTALPIAEIALRLGYSEPSAFHRAFRGWTGAAPGHLRKRAKEESTSR
jgi:AraC-like DNA-binding protein